MDETIKPNEVDLRLIIVDFNEVTHDDITLMIGVKPTYVRIKGIQETLTELIPHYGLIIYGR